MFLWGHNEPAAFSHDDGLKINQDTDRELNVSFIKSFT